MSKSASAYLFLLGLALAGLLALQVGWLWKAANLREELFEEKVRRVLQQTASEVGSLVDWKDGNLSMAPLAVKRVDSLFARNLRSYGIELPYTFRVDRLAPAGFGGTIPLKKNPETFATCLPGPDSQTGVLLELQFPEKSRFLWEEMGFQFALSLGLISVLLAVSWLGISRFRKEQEVMEQATVFLHNMTHEWKTPIATIRLAIRRLQEAVSKGQQDRVLRYAGMVEEENTRLARQVEWVLDMQGIRHSSWEPGKDKLDLVELLRQLGQDFSLLAEEKDITLQLEGISEPLPFSGDGWALGVILRNLVDNAIRYSPVGTLVKLSVSKPAAQIEIRVRDEGPGILPQYRERIFEAYFRVSQGDRHEVKGFGLGLSYARTLACKMGFELKLEESSPAGSVFLLRMPYA